MQGCKVRSGGTGFGGLVVDEAVFQIGCSAGFEGHVVDGALAGGEVAVAGNFSLEGCVQAVELYLLHGEMAWGLLVATDHHQRLLSGGENEGVAEAGLDFV